MVLKLEMVNRHNSALQTVRLWFHGAGLVIKAQNDWQMDSLQWLFITECHLLLLVLLLYCTNGSETVTTNAEGHCAKTTSRIYSYNWHSYLRSSLKCFEQQHV